MEVNVNASEAVLSKIKQNPDDTRQHVEMIHTVAERAGATGKIIVASFGQNPTTGIDIPPKIGHFRVGDIDGTMAFIKRIQNDRHRNIYVPLCTMRTNLPAGLKGSEQDIEKTIGFCGDFDDERACEYSDRLPLPPDCVIESSPGRFQTLYLFNRGLSFAEAKPLAQALGKGTGCDFCTKDLSHVWRIPGQLNWPNGKKVKAGRSPEPCLATVHEIWDNTFTDPDEIRNAIGVSHKK
ncbi:DNA-primase RepB domain-containing protein [Desulfosarcina ovata]|uniref:DNA-primase RepB domain-containing protein n=1 Tax=Desulfosarcina ovata TaxID=83564 RepID=UPI001391168F|nr:DNA-primase RepB domain-containing protein [Desulfosarcina ovata]